MKEIEKVTILALDDDNHSPCYALPNRYWSNAHQLMTEMLCEPHNKKFVIKEIKLIYLNPYILHKGKTLIELFDMLDSKPNFKEMPCDKYIERKEAYEFFVNMPIEELYKED